MKRGYKIRRFKEKSRKFIIVNYYEKLKKKINHEIFTNLTIYGGKYEH